MGRVTSAGNVSDLVATAAATWPSATAVIDCSSAETLTWQQLDGAINAEVLRLTEAGVRPGDRVVVRLPTSATFATTMFATLRAGAIVVPVSPQAPAEELTRVREHSGAAVVVGDGAGAAALLPPDLTHATAASEPVGGGEDIGMLCYSTTARGVLLSHRALLANVQQVGWLRPAPMTVGDRVLVALPLCHVYGFALGLLQPAATGATAVLAERFDARQALAECQRYAVTVVLGVPTMYADFATLPAQELADGLSSVRLLISGAAPLHPKVLASVEEATGLGVYEGYGLTETAPVLTTTIATGYPKPGSVGRPLDGVQLRLVDESDGDVLAGAVPTDVDEPDDVLDTDEGGTGLVSVRGANLFSGYWPDGAGGPDADGWFCTNDVGFLDNDGDLHLVDRVDDVIIVNGFNVYPHEVEYVLTELADVAAAAVVGVLDDRSGQAVKAVVVAAGDAAPSEQHLIEHCAGKLARYKVPRVVEFVDALPHTDTGKLYRSVLR